MKRYRSLRFTRVRGLRGLPGLTALCDLPVQPSLASLLDFFVAAAGDLVKFANELSNLPRAVLTQCWGLVIYPPPFSTHLSRGS